MSTDYQLNRRRIVKGALNLDRGRWGVNQSGRGGVVNKVRQRGVNDLGAIPSELDRANLSGSAPISRAFARNVHTPVVSIVPSRVTGELRHLVLARLRRGERLIVLDLSGVSTIDAAGVGHLVRAYNVTKAANGTLRIVRATRWVREVLERAGLFGLLA